MSCKMYLKYHKWVILLKIDPCGISDIQNINWILDADAFNVLGSNTVYVKK